MKSLLIALKSLSKIKVTIACLLLLLVIGLVDYLTGVEISFSIFYMIPIGMASWYGGRSEGLLLSGIGALTWFLAGFFWPAAASNLIILFWNTMVRLAFFLILVFLLSAIKSRNELLEQRVMERTLQLTKKIEETDRLNLEREKLVGDLQRALAKVKQFGGLIPICASCKSIRDDQGYWNQVEQYLQRHSEAEFTHGICPECARKLYPDISVEAK